MNFLAKTTFFSLLAGASMLLASTSAFAYDFEVCDPNEDPDACQCPTNTGNHDTCDVISVSDIGDLVGSDDPSELRDELGITSTYNSTEGVWEVDIDVSTLNDIGLLVGHSNEGQWQDIHEMHDYLKELLDIPSSEEFDTLFPPVSLVQRGGYAKYDPTDHEFASRTYNNLIYDVVSDKDGNVFFDGEPAEALNGLFFNPIDCSGDFASGTSGERQRCQCKYQIMEFPMLYYALVNIFF